MKLTRQSFLFNKRVEYQKRIDHFPTQVKVIFGGAIFVALIIAIVLFCISVRAMEEVFRQFNF